MPFRVGILIGDAARASGGSNGHRVEAFVADDVLSDAVFDEPRSDGVVVHFACGCDDLDEVAVRVTTSVKLGGEASAGLADGLGRLVSSTCTVRVGVNFDRSGVEKVPLVIEFTAKGLKDLSPHSSLRPPMKEIVDGRPRTELGRQRSPGTTLAHPPDKRVHVRAQFADVAHSTSV